MNAGYWRRIKGGPRKLATPWASPAGIATLVLASFLGVAAPVEAEVRTAIEYKLASYWDDYGPYSDDAYFVTAFPQEIASLRVAIDSGAFVLTDESFDIWSEPTEGAVPTCRFWGAAFFSHVFTPYGAECAKLRADPNWLYEGIAFYVKLPDENGDCPDGTTALYRLYNNGRGTRDGTPHHRLTARDATRDGMLAAGWIAEGHGRTLSFACVPAPLSPPMSN